MKSTGYIFFILISLLFQNIVFTQDRVSEAIENADYIFKGIVLEIHPIKKLDGKDYISYKIAIEEKYKGDKKLGSQDTVELVTTLPFGWYIMNDGVGRDEILVYDIPYLENNGMGISIGIGGIFFTQNNTTSLSKNYGTLSLIPICDFTDCYFRMREMFHYDKVTNKRAKMLDIDGFGRHFNNLNTFQNYLKGFGVDITTGNSDRKRSPLNRKGDK